ncbi:hypothetical protein VXL81_07290 [Phaeobacter sp. JH204B]
MDKAAVSRALSHGVNLEVKFEGRYPTGPNGEYLPGYEVAVGCRIHGTTAQREAAIEDLKKFQTPAPIPQIERWLAELSVLTAGRGTDGIAAELQLTAYSSRLAQFPADVVRYALLQQTWKWFPSWDEIERLCKAKSSPRRHMIAALSQPEPDPEPVRRPPTDDERARIQAMVDEMFPRQSPEDRKAAVDIALKGDCMVGDPEQALFREAAE